MDNNYILLIIIYENLKKIFGLSESLRLEICYYTCPASEFEHSMSELNIFFLNIDFCFLPYKSDIIMQFISMERQLYQLSDDIILM